jgi:uncharacterized protein DUF1579
MSIKQTLVVSLAGGAMVAVGLAGFVSGRASSPIVSVGVETVSQPDGMDAEMMKKMIAEQAELAPEHKNFLPMVGTFACEMRFMMAPGQEPEVSTGKSVNELILGGRFMKTDFSGEMEMFGDKMDFAGFGLLGFDKGKGEYVSTWCDSMTTSLMVATGKPGDDAKTITVMGTTQSPMGAVQMKSVYEIESDDKYTMVFYQAMPGMDEMMKIGWITCIRETED